MKIAYTISGLYNSGGMENILLQKANYLAEVYGHDVTIITTDQKNRPIFFHISSRIKLIDLGINYCDDKKKKFWHLKKLFLKRRHKTRLSDILSKEHFNVCISLMDFDFSFITSINDGSKKIGEYHFSRYAKALATNNFLKRAIQRFRTTLWKTHIKKFDRFIVLTEQDKRQWGNLRNITVIPNFINYFPDSSYNPDTRNIISVGRMDFQKGFDLLLGAWEIASKKLPDWHLSIFGGGDSQYLQNIINEKNIERIILHPPVTDIGDKYNKSSLYVMSSRFEGLPLVLLEAMSYGLPIVSFDCPCGPKDIIHSDFGKLVKSGDIERLANAIIECANNREWRVNASEPAKKYSHNYSKNRIMEKWNDLLISYKNND